MIESNIRKLLEEIPKKNKFGEEITLVAAIKTQTPESVNRAICAGIRNVGDNHAQEVRDNYGKICGNPKRHFIGRLQSNKIKYLLGRIDLYHSIDRISIAEALNEKSAAAGIVSHILLQVNAGNEESKGGFSFEELFDAYATIKDFPNLKIQGLMAMLPNSDDKDFLYSLAVKMREKYDILRGQDKNFKYLSMGMSGDWKICIDAGSNMIRLGTAIFGERNYSK